MKLPSQSVALLAAIGMLCSPIAAQANTRAGDRSTTYPVPASVQAGALPQSSWLIPDEDDTSPLWIWLAGGGSVFLLLSAVISNEPSSDRRPGNSSNGAN